MSKYGILPFIVTIVTAGTAFALESFTTNAGRYTYTYTCQNSCVVSGGSLRDSAGGLVSVTRTVTEVEYNRR